MATATQEVPEGERLARIEATLEAVLREMNDANADRLDIRADMRDICTEIRDIRSMINRNTFMIVGFIVGTWITVILTILFKG